MMPGVSNACCGHGYIGLAYIAWNDGSSVRGEEAEPFICERRREVQAHPGQPLTSDRPRIAGNPETSGS